MYKKEQKIYEALKNFGGELAAFYKDGVKIKRSKFDAKSNFLGHALREMDSRLRETFEVEEDKTQMAKKISQEQLLEVFNSLKSEFEGYDYLKNKTFKEFKEKKNHIASILISFGFGLGSKLFIKYLKVIRWMHEYSHARGENDTPRLPDDIIKLWNEYEEVLLELFGDEYKLHHKIDLILDKQKPTEKMILRLRSLLKLKAREVYFFNKLEHLGWLIVLHQEGYFSGKNNPSPIEDELNPGHYQTPRWSSTSYLEKISTLNQTNPKQKICETIVSIITDIAFYQNQNNKRIENYHTDYAIFKMILALPVPYITPKLLKHINTIVITRWNELIHYDYKLFIEKAIEENDKKLMLSAVSTLFSYQTSEGDSILRVKPYIDSHQIKSILDDYKLQIINTGKTDLLKKGIDLIKSILRVDSTAFNNISIPAIEDNSQTSFPEKIDCQLTYLVRDTILNINKSSRKKYTIELLNEAHPIFKRIAIHTINHKYSELNELFWTLEFSPLEWLLKHESYELLKINATNISDEQVDIFLNWVESEEYDYITQNYNEEDSAIKIAYHRKEWLSALLELENDKIKDTYSHFDSINKIEIENPGYNSWSSGTIMGHESPVTTESLSTKSVKEIINEFIAFSSKEQSFMGPSSEGFAEKISADVSNNPKKYSDEASEIIKSQTAHFFYAWIYGLHNVVKNSLGDLNVPTTIDICSNIIMNNDYWVDANTRNGYRRQALGLLLPILDDILNDDNYKLTDNELLNTKKLLLNIYNENKVAVFSYEDTTMTALNNIKGQVLTTLVYYSHRCKRKDEENSPKWDSDIKTIFNHLLAVKENNSLYFNCLGRHIRNLYYIDDKWVLDSLVYIFPINDEGNWVTSISAYFFYNGYPAPKYFDFFTEKGHFKKIIESRNLLSYDSYSNAINHILITYLDDKINLKFEELPFKELLNSSEKDAFDAVIRFFWNKRIPKHHKEKVKTLWLFLYESSIQMKRPDLDEFILSGCVKWFKFFDSLDSKLFKALREGVKLLATNDKYFFFEDLSKIFDNEPKKCGELMLIAFQDAPTYDISRGLIAEMTEKLYQLGFKDLADRICVLHIENELYFLREVFELYNQQK